MVVTWHHITRVVSIYANGKEIGKRTYCPNETFYGPTGKPYMIGNDGLKDNHQFQGSVMDLHVFGVALFPDEINMLRGMRYINIFKFKCNLFKLQSSLQ